MQANCSGTLAPDDSEPQDVQEAFQRALNDVQGALDDRVWPKVALPARRVFLDEMYEQVYLLLYGYLLGDRPITMGVPSRIAAVWASGAMPVTYADGAPESTLYVYAP